MEFPRQDEKMMGWTIDYDFLQQIKKTITSKSKENITLEAIEDVLIAVEKVEKKREVK